MGIPPWMATEADAQDAFDVSATKAPITRFVLRYQHKEWLHKQELAKAKAEREKKAEKEECAADAGQRNA